MSDIKLKAANGGGSISLKGPSTLGSDRDLVDTSGNINLLDSQKVKVGTDADLQLFHDGVSRIIHSGAGNLLVATEGDSAEDLYLRAKDKVVLQANNGNDSVICNAAGSTALYHNNTLQCETSANGLAFPSGKGIDFSANTNNATTGTSTTGELLDHYEEGSWTPTAKEGSLTYADGHYVRIGKMVYATFEVTYDANSGSGHQGIGYLPFTSANESLSYGCSQGYTNYNDSNTLTWHISNNSNNAWLYASGGGVGALSESNVAGHNFRGTFIYEVP